MDPRPRLSSMYGDNKLGLEHWTRKRKDKIPRQFKPIKKIEPNPLNVNAS